ncbi:MAG: GNAT family N-acetyltransferase, partial [Rhizobium sp.]
MINLRAVQSGDIDQLYVISLVTGDAGRDATPLHRDGRMIGHIYSVPYAVLSPETVFVAEDEEGVCGYIAGVFDTVAFEDRLEREWWPQLRERY